MTARGNPLKTGAFFALCLALFIGAMMFAVAPGAQGRPTPTPPPGGSIGYVGCSNTAASVSGYHQIGAQKMWPFIRNYGGGTVATWEDGIGVNGNRYWSAFARQQQQAPATTFWFQLCAQESDPQDLVETDAAAVIAEIQLRVPGATIYVSALNGFVAPHVCSICGPDGVAFVEVAAANLIASGVALDGPDLGALISTYQVPSEGATLATNQTQDDGCHPNTAGKAFLGEPLLSFFG